ncbi:deoxyribodipyrimidine photo-lyase [Aquimarina sp. ERC-38]|uniref:cryptochrome/deoxyribodipyrimidine photo-lyase family protein n=1 Tax=Aquimarina sp. ERC-38 TaxID=2949996 RepID=UPI0022480B92|nr:FAD-binding domain-containing protein [Aquimarina sp. ERC-38]UZO80095.1 deoxyribodipyrimidine photo-lyase [Aquimarina sp. ERC-38]
MKTAVYWIKRDFRIFDNIALTHALEAFDQVIPIYIIEPSFLEAPDTSLLHTYAITTALTDLVTNYKKRDGEIIIYKGEVVDIFKEVHKHVPFNAIYAHEEIGTNRTYKRDIAVREWSDSIGTSFKEFAQTAVFRNFYDRDKRHTLWKEFTNEELLPIPSTLHKCKVPSEIKKFSCTDYQKELDAPKSTTLRDTLDYDQIQKVSESNAEKDLTSFLYERGIAYRGGISSPLTAFTAGSRTSVHMAWGTMTGRTIYQRTQNRMDELLELKEKGDPDAGKWRMSLRSFMSRLHWRDHFIQRLETDPQMEFQALNVAYEDLFYENDPAHYQAWITGTTGFPMIDACIRCLYQTGFLNFRMRALLTSFACHTLHISWKLINYPMAQLYTDYEPGIHISQLQMQASVVGINTVRIYSPTKQIIDQDPEAVFIKKFVPELRPFSAEEIIAHTDTPLGDYPAQIVDWKTASTEMRTRIYAVRKQEGYREIAAKVYEKHGSRRSSGKKARPKKTKAKAST